MPKASDPEVRAVLRVTLLPKSPSQVALLLYTIQAAGGDLDKVEVESSRGMVSGKVALEAWEKKWGKTLIAEGGKTKGKKEKP